MGSNDSAPSHAPYEEMKDTPWITQGREIADVGGKGILSNYKNVDVFDEATNKSIEARNNEVAKRALSDMEKAYTSTMNKYAAANYNRFGSLNSTPSSYITDQYRQDFQRQMDDWAYNKALNYETLRDQELARRYNTLNMYQTLYNMGQVPYQQDIMNWNTRNTNKDLDYQNQIMAYQVAQNSLGNKLLNVGLSTLGSLGSGMGSSFGKDIGSTLASKVFGGGTN